MRILSLTQHSMGTSGIQFKIITTEENIQFLDENGGQLNWDNNLGNQLEVYGMVKVLEGYSSVSSLEADTSVLSA
jgi:hypothetical protein